MATQKSTHRRGELALTEIDALAVNLIHDVRSLEARLERGGLGLAVLAYPELRIIEAGAECIRAETQEARAETQEARAAAASGAVEQTPAERAADMAEATRAQRPPCAVAPTSPRPAA